MRFAYKVLLDRLNSEFSYTNAVNIPRNFSHFATAKIAPYMAERVFRSFTETKKYF